MNERMLHAALHTSSEKLLERSYWYGANLATIFTRASETNGAFSVIKTLLRKGFEPPLHVHSREEESNYILEGEIVYEAGGDFMYAKPGDYVYLPRQVPHTFKLVSETASTLLVITPGGFEEMFIECGRPALKLELPPLADKPPTAFFEKIIKVNEALGVTIFTA